MSENLQFLSFVKKKVVSLQSDEKGSDFRYKVLSLELYTFRNIARNEHKCLHFADLLVCNR